MGCCSDLTPRGFSIVRFVLQHLLGERPIEELDEGPKAERTDQGAKAHKATQQPAQQGAERIGEDTAPEVRAGCVVPQTEGKVIVGRDAKVGGLVERSAQRRDQHRRPWPFAPCLLKSNQGAVKPPTVIDFYQSCNQFCA